MKRIPIILAVAWGCAASAWGGVNITWQTGWGAYAHGATNLVGESDRLLDGYSAAWQLVWTGADGEIDPPDLCNPTNGFVGGDDEVWAQRVIPMGGGPAEDGTVWDGYMYWTGGSSPVYEDLSWGTPGFVYMRVYEGPPSFESWYYDSPPLALDVDYDPMIPLTQDFLLGTWEVGFQPDRQIPADGAYLFITNEDATVPYVASNLTVGGESLGLDSDISWVDDLTGESGHIAAADHWSFICGLGVGRNEITVSGSQDLEPISGVPGFYSMYDRLTIVREAAPKLSFAPNGSGNLLFGVPAPYVLDEVQGADPKLSGQDFDWSNLTEGVHYTTSGTNVAVQPAGLRKLIRVRLIYP